MRFPTRSFFPTILPAALCGALLAGGCEVSAMTERDPCPWPLIPAPTVFTPLAGEADLAAGPVERFLLQPESGLDPEAFTIELRPDTITVTAATDQGLFRGRMALAQLETIATGPVPCGRAVFTPAFGWRGMLLDCGRHFMPPEVVEGVIDRLAAYGFNVLHWHLTEDQGWRLEVPGYPLLTEVGSRRVGPDGVVHEGYYTTEDVRRILAYAAERHVTVVPEIEMPGHCVAALAAYPELSCTGGPFEVETQWGIHPDIYCAGKERTFAFLQDVLDHVIELFPSVAIHAGGDEAPRDRWRTCPDCQARIRAEGLADEDELQRWFILRIERYLSAKGRRLIGWDEILDGGLTEAGAGAIVQSWRGTGGARAAARAGLEAIVSPTSHCYFDYDPGVLDILQVYGFDPVPEGLTPEEESRILGGEMNLWTEYVPSQRVDTMLLPRMCAMAEALWTGTAGRSFSEFWDRLRRQGPVWQGLGAVPGPAARPLTIDCEATGGGHRAAVTIDPRFRLAFGDSVLEIRHRILDAPPAGFEPRLPAEQPGLPEVAAADPVLHGTLDLSLEDRRSPLLLARLFVDGEPFGAPAAAEFTGHLGLGRMVTLTAPPDPRYPAGGAAGLVDGMRGGPDFRSGRWAGFEGIDCEATIDLGAAVPVAEISVRFLQDANRWIFLPARVEVTVAGKDGRWSQPAALTHGVSDRVQSVTIEEFVAPMGGGAPVRFVRVKGVNPGPCPDWHPGRGRPSWIFADEIVVR